MNTPIPEDDLNSLKQLLFEGRKIEAIKLLRTKTGGGLAESKDAVDKLENELRTTAPEQFTPRTEDRGCLGLLIMICACGAIVLSWIISK